MTDLRGRRRAAAVDQLYRTVAKRDEALERLCKLTAQIKKLSRTVARLSKPVAPKVSVAAGSVQPAAPVPAAPVVPPALDDDLPDFLDRRKAKPAAPAVVPKPAGPALPAARSFDPYADVRNEQRKVKARGRIAKMKAKQSGEASKMPLSGRAALAAIRAAKLPDAPAEAQAMLARAIGGE